MERNDIIVAPETASLQTVFATWQTNHAGGLQQFYDFMTQPSVERERFLAEASKESNFSGSTLTTKI